VKNFVGFTSIDPAGRIPMRVSDSSVGGEAGQFHTRRWTLVLASARDQSQAGRAALAAFCDALAAAEGRLKP
jgi:hypothetical protein